MDRTDIGSPTGRACASSPRKGSSVRSYLLALPFCGQGIGSLQVFGTFWRWCRAGTLVCGLSAAAMPCLGQGRPAQPQASRPVDPFLGAMSRWDLDHDGILTCEEWARFAGQLFRRADKNDDGMLDAQEFLTLRKLDPILADADLAYFDDNQDGRVTRGEFIDRPNPIFARYDRNHDCQVTADELQRDSPDSKPKPPQGLGGNSPSAPR